MGRRVQTKQQFCPIFKQFVHPCNESQRNQNSNQLDVNWWTGAPNIEHQTIITSFFLLPLRCFHWFYLHCMAADLFYNIIFFYGEFHSESHESNWIGFFVYVLRVYFYVCGCCENWIYFELQDDWNHLN